jgi:hypothetical protein
MRKQKESKISFPKETGKKKLSISTFIIALGTIVGIYIGIDKIYYNRVIFGFEPSGILTGTLASDSNGNNILMLFGAVTNAGTKPLNPISFSLKVKIENKWIFLQRMAIPEICVFNSEQQSIEVPEPSKSDLQEWKRPITMEEPARGSLMFVSNELDIESLRESNEITFQLTCIDIFKDEYTVTISYGPFAKFDKPVGLIKHGVIFGPKEEQR